MRQFARPLFVLITALTLAAPSWGSTRAQQYSRIFWMPEYHGQRLNYCMLKGQCGMDVAMKYCKMMGFEKADQEVIAHNLGLTNYLDSNFRCKGWQCNGFKMIRCVSSNTHKPPSAYHYRLRRYVYPRFGNYRVDWCYDGTTGCGAKVAHSFCRRMGYLKSHNHVKQEHVAATKAIGNQKLCFGNECSAFKQIDCYR